MKLNILIILLFLICIPSNMLPNKLVLKSDSAKGNSVSIDCPDSNNCYTVFQVGEFQKLYKSTDQGNTWVLTYQSETMWDQINQGIAVLMNVEDGCSPDPEYYFMSMYDEGYIKKSSDGGKTFERIDLNEKYRVSEIAMHDTNIGVAYSYSGKIYLTYDSWKTWEFNYTPTLNDSIYLSGFWRPIFRGKDSISAICSILNSQDTSMIGVGLLTWNYRINKWNYILLAKTTYDDNGSPDTGSESPQQPFFINKNYGFICGGKKRGIGQTQNDLIYKTTDGGKSWKKVLDSFQQGTSAWGLQQIAFKDELIGVAVGALGVVIITSDGGDTWEYLKYPAILRESPIMKVTWAGEYPIFASWRGIWRLEGPDGGPPVFKAPLVPSILANDHNFGVHDLSFPDTLSQIMKIYNTADSVDLRISDYSALTDSAFWTDLPEVDSLNPIVIKPTENLEYTVFFSPKEIRKYSDSIIFYSNAKDSDNVAYLHGEGIDTVEISVKERGGNNLNINVRHSDDKLLVNIRSPNFRTYNLQIYDIIGNIVLQKELQSGIGTLYKSIDISGLSPGAYLWMISANRILIKTGKIIPITN